MASYNEDTHNAVECKLREAQECKQVSETPPVLDADYIELQMRKYAEEYEREQEAQRAEDTLELADVKERLEQQELVLVQLLNERKEVFQQLDLRMASYMDAWAKLFTMQSDLIRKKASGASAGTAHLVPAGEGTDEPVNAQTVWLKRYSDGRNTLTQLTEEGPVETAVEKYQFANMQEILNNVVVGGPAAPMNIYRTGGLDHE